MNFMKKTKLAVFIALLSGGSAYAQNSSIHDDTIDAPDDTWQAAETGRLESRAEAQAAQREGNQQQNSRDATMAGSNNANQGSDTAERMENRADRMEDSAEEKLDNSGLTKRDADRSPQSGAMATTDRSSDLERENQQASNMQAGSKEDTVYFEFDSAELTGEAKDKLSQLVEDMKGKDEPLSITVAGHTDQTGPEPYNEDLAERRAEAVKDYLKQSELEVSNVDIRAVGESNPISEDAAENRRVEIEKEGESEGLSATSAE